MSRRRGEQHDVMMIGFTIGFVVLCLAFPILIVAAFLAT